MPRLTGYATCCRKLGVHFRVVAADGGTVLAAAAAAAAPARN
jgi:hypothetical protein